ncbi:hypothetical protein [Burkholderia vietnamiensis]|uniref:hypothetical protein n=1 Tax=Burkholderia vietnamiensis TaxID=60552 RepID=UPI0018C6FEFF|nr:hypothetical protein [Burkholderia vietnamiensis]
MLLSSIVLPVGAALAFAGAQTGALRPSGEPSRHQRASSPHAAVEAERSLACAVLQCGDGASLRSGPAALLREHVRACVGCTCERDESQGVMRSTAAAVVIDMIRSERADAPPPL